MAARSTPKPNAKPQPDLEDAPAEPVDTTEPDAQTDVESDDVEDTPTTDQDAQTYATDGNTSGAQPTSGPELDHHDEWDPDSDLTPAEHLATATNELPDELPTDGHVWVQRKKTAVQLGVINYKDDGPQLVDAKSVPELALQGYVIVDPPTE